MKLLRTLKSFQIFKSEIKKSKIYSGWCPFQGLSNGTLSCRSNLAGRYSVPLKVQSGQIGSAWEWYYWIGLKKDINCYMVLIFLFWSWIFENSSKFWAASYKNASNPPSCCDHRLFRILSCYWMSHFYLLRNPTKCCSILVWIADCWFPWNILLTSCNPKNNCWISRIFGAWFGGKDRGMCPYNPWSQQVGGLDAFL